MYGRVLSFLIRHFNNYYTLHRSDLAARAAPLDPRFLRYQIEIPCAYWIKLISITETFTTKVVYCIRIFATYHLMLVTKKRIFWKTNHQIIVMISCHCRLCQWIAKNVNVLIGLVCIRVSYFYNCTSFTKHEIN